MSLNQMGNTNGTTSATSKDTIVLQKKCETCNAIFTVAQYGIPGPILFAARCPACQKKLTDSTAADLANSSPEGRSTDRNPQSCIEGKCSDRSGDHPDITIEDC